MTGPRAAALWLATLSACAPLREDPETGDRPDGSAGAQVGLADAQAWPADTGPTTAATDGAPRADGSTTVPDSDAGAREAGAGDARPADVRPIDAALDGRPMDAPDARPMDAPDVRPPLDGRGGPPALRPVFVIVGDDGRRARSLDLGLTWVDEQRLTPDRPGDEVYFRGVTHGNGLFVATGYRIYTSPDGATWTRRQNPEEQWLIGPVWHDGIFVAAGGYGYSAYSLDGLTWVAGGMRGTEPARSLVSFGGQVIAATDEGNWWTTRDGIAWTRSSSGHSSEVVVCGDRVADAQDCPGPFGRNGGATTYGAGVFVTVGEVVERSTDGVTWQATLGSGYYDVAFGLIP